jgi:hypothetical protein
MWLARLFDDVIPREGVERSSLLTTFCARKRVLLRSASDPERGS